MIKIWEFPSQYISIYKITMFNHVIEYNNFYGYR